MTHNRCFVKDGKSSNRQVCTSVNAIGIFYMFGRSSKTNKGLESYVRGTNQLRIGTKIETEKAVRAQQSENPNFLWINVLTQRFAQLCSTQR